MSELFQRNNLEKQCLFCFKIGSLERNQTKLQGIMHYFVKFWTKDKLRMMVILQRKRNRWFGLVLSSRTVKVIYDESLVFYDFILEAFLSFDLGCARRTTVWLKRYEAAHWSSGPMSYDMKHSHNAQSLRKFPNCFWTEKFYDIRKASDEAQRLTDSDYQAVTTMQWLSSTVRQWLASDS